ncbi:MAG: D-alanine--D-alanine ligase [Bacteroidia bacterium]|nr:D-alanine--D-alanine ligase [Bacteroidia bacterium]MDW8014753.1 D-alanine--D-alanine ligase [Bacteroidia bacterium]
MRIGILFGGASREREVSYAGGRTVFDLIDRRKFDPIPIFLDAFHRMVRLRTDFLYYGMICDFFPPPEDVPREIRFPIYAEQLYYPESSAYMRALSRLGPLLSLESLTREIDFAFLVLHGVGGEDGSIQGLLEQLGIPYVGSGVGGSAWGLDKSAQRQWLERHGFEVPRYCILQRDLLWKEPNAISAQVAELVGFPCVVKHPWQGSTIGVAVCYDPSSLVEACMRCSFTFPARRLTEIPLASLLDLTEGIGLPFLYRDREGSPQELVTDWTELMHFLRRCPQHGFVEAWDSPPFLLIEEFVEGEEFSVIVIETPNGTMVALPPTHIQKPTRLYDYRAKYLSGISSKKTPSPTLPNEEIQREAERLALTARLNVYARLDGIVSRKGRVFFNDPNTTSGMLPASLLFHQAAEIGFTPTDFLSYLIELSLRQPRTGPIPAFLRRHRLTLSEDKRFSSSKKLRVGVIFGGPSSERHISLESGRNVIEKLSSTYEVIPLFLLVKEDALELWRVPPRLLFKDNADDVAAALSHTEIPLPVKAARQRLEAEKLFSLYLLPSYFAERIAWDTLAQEVDFVFLALHGRPGEDGTVQRKVETLGLPYNGSPPPVCALLMDKYATYKYLQKSGFKVPPHFRVKKEEWKTNPAGVFQGVESLIGSYPVIAKPVDEGCSMGVRLLTQPRQLKTYLNALFREEESLPLSFQQELGLKENEFFPRKTEALIEKYLQGPQWVEVTVGVITHTEGKKVRYQAFLPSETVKEGNILGLEEKFLAGAGQNVTPARLYPEDPGLNARALATIQRKVEAIAASLGIHGYARIDGFVEIRGEGEVEFWTLEVNALPGLTPATVFFHQAILAGYTPLQILEHIMDEGRKRRDEAGF